MDRRVTTTRGRRGARRTGARRLALVLGAGIILGASTLTAQERTRSDECRCVDPDGNEIENCTCIVRPDIDAYARVWSYALPNRARIGVTVSSQQEARYDRDGARVQDVLEEGPADEAGLREGDVIVRVDGRSLFEPLEDPDEEERLDLDESAPVQRLLALLGDLEPGDEVEIEYLRDGETRRAVVEAESNPARFGGTYSFRSGEGPAVLFRPDTNFHGLVRPREGRALSFGFPEGMSRFHVDSLRSLEGDELHGLVIGRMDPCFTGGPGGSGSAFLFGGNCVDGLVLTPMNPDLGSYFGADEGLLVTEVREGSTLGLQPGDVLLAVDGREVEDVSHARRILQSYEPDEELTLRIMRQGEATEITGRRR